MKRTLRRLWLDIRCMATEPAMRRDWVNSRYRRARWMLQAVVWWLGIRPQMEKHHLGFGNLSWGRGESIGGRYGAVGLWDVADDEDLPADWMERCVAILGPDAPSSLYLRDENVVGKRGALFACLLVEVNVWSALRQRFDFDIEGVLYRRGRAVRLSDEGTFFAEETDKGPRIGVRPDDGRTYDWLEYGPLYQCDHELVELYAMIMPPRQKETTHAKVPQAPSSD